MTSDDRRNLYDNEWSNNVWSQPSGYKHNKIPQSIKECEQHIKFEFKKGNWKKIDELLDILNELISK